MFIFEDREAVIRMIIEGRSLALTLLRWIGHLR